MSDFSRTFNDLALVSKKFLEVVSIAEDELARNLRSLNSLEKDALLFVFGCHYFEMDLKDAILRFRSNRYFIDALGISITPEAYVIHHVLNKLEKIKYNESSIRNYFNQVVQAFTENQITNSSDFIFNESKINLDYFYPILLRFFPVIEL